LRPGDLDPARVDDALRRLLRLKWELGLFDDPFGAETGEVVEPSAEARAAALTAAERSAVLLVNDGTLPLPRRPRRVLLVGPYATSRDHLGCWVQRFAAPARSLAEALVEACPEWAVSELPGAVFLGDRPDLRAEAVAAAGEHDVVIAAVGEPSALSGEAASRSDLRLPGDQESLLTALAASGVPLAVVLVTGRPLVTSAWIDGASAVLQAWHLGLEGPTAIARLLTGLVDPGGRLPVSFPRAVGQVPIYYHHEHTGRPATTGGSLEVVDHDEGLIGPADTADKFTSKYLDLDLGPQFAFGHGLSYTTFSHATPTVDPVTIRRSDLAAGAACRVSVDVANTGERDGDVVTMLFVRDRIASLAPPVRKLRGFERHRLEPGERRDVSFRVGWDDLAIWTAAGAVDVEPGEFEIHVGDGLEHTLSCLLTVLGG
jgi:beta-glucosidase